MKKFVAGFLCCAIVMSGLTVFAESITKNIDAAFGQVKLVVNGKAVDKETLLYNGTTYIPLRAAAETLGMEVGWDEKTSTASLTDIPAKQEDPIILAAGQYVVGEDIMAGKYDCLAISGFGNFSGTVKELGFMGLNEILGALGTSYENTQTYSNLRLTDGDIIKIGGDLKVQFTKK